MLKSELDSKLNKTLDFLKSELNQIRTGRATPTLIENIVADAYGSKMTLKELGSITSLDSQTLVVTPWDSGNASSILKAIRESELHLNPIDDSGRVRVPIPSLTEERRKEFIKLASVKLEECRQAIRSVRQEAMKDVDASFAKKELSEDEKFSMKEDIEDLIKKYTGQAEEIAEAKKEDLLKI